MFEFFIGSNSITSMKTCSAVFRFSLNPDYTRRLFFAQGSTVCRSKSFSRHDFKVLIKQKQ